MIPDDVLLTVVAVYEESGIPVKYRKGIVRIAHAIMAERERCAKIAETYARDASFDDSAVGAIEHNANQQNIAHAIRNP